ncbi:MAG: VWA domain-containing protein, partial [Thermoanaerobaculia bacterium]
METRRLFLPGLFLLAAAAASPAPDAGKPRQIPIKTKVGTFPLGIEAEYLGMAGKKTVVRIRLTAPELTREAVSRGIQGFSGQLKGGFRQAETEVDSFQYPVTADIARNAPFAYSFLRALPPGTYRLRLLLADSDGRDMGEGSVDLLVPELGTAFRPEMAPGEAGTLPSAEAIVIADEVAEKPATPEEPKLKILPPSREAPIGLLRLEAVVAPPIERVEFYLEEKRLVTRNRPPYSVEIDLGAVPRRQTVRAVGYDDTGRVIDEDAYAINQGKDRLAVRLLPRPDGSAGVVRVKVIVQSIGGGAAKSLELFLDEKKLASWTTPPYETAIPIAQWARASVLRATAIGEDGQEANDIRMLKGPTTTVETVRVDVVQLHVSALDKSGRFVKGLTRGDFSIREDGRPEEMTGFEVAENLPLTVGLVIDGSGSMEKSLTFVHDASAALFKNLIRPKDQGFVVEFRDRTKFLQELTSDSVALQRAASSSRAEGATALYDAIVLGLYQFRTLQGRKALVVVSDGDDNRSHVDIETLVRYARSAGAPIYFIGLGIPITDFRSRKVSKQIAEESGGQVLFMGNAEKMGEVTQRIEEELRSQYVLAFRSSSSKPPGEYRAVEVAVARPGITARTIRGYIP